MANLKDLRNMANHNKNTYATPYDFKVLEAVDRAIAAEATLFELEKQEPVGVFSGAFRFSEGKSYFEVRCYDALPAAGTKLYASPAQQSPAVAIPDFLLEMSQQMREQPSRSTSHPFWQVRCKRYIVTEQGYNEHHWEICCDDGVIYSSLDPIEELHEYLNENHSEFVANWNSFNEAESIDEWFDATDDNLPDGLRLVYVQEIEEVVSTHLTEAGAKAFIDRKQHDYPKLYTYVESAYWSPQLRQLQDWIISLSAPTPPSSDHFRDATKMVEQPDSEAPAIDSNNCALNTITDNQVGKVVRAFWRRIYPYRNNHERDLPAQIPVEFMSFMATALHWIDKPQADYKAQRDELAELLGDIQAVISESRGIIGYHLNGDIALWDEFDCFQNIPAAIAKCEGGK